MAEVELQDQERHRTKKQPAVLATVIGIVTLLLLGAVILIASFMQTNETATDPAQSDAARFASEYTKVPVDNRFVYATGKDVIDVFQKGTGLVFLGFPECPWCQQLAPIANEAAKAENLDKIYYLNILESRKDNDETYQKLVGFLSKYLEKDDNGEPRIYVPDVSAVLDGNIVSRFKQESTEGPTTPDEFWTTERRQRGIDQLREMIKQVK